MNIIAVYEYNYGFSQKWWLEYEDGSGEWTYVFLAKYEPLLKSGEPLNR